MVVVVEVHTVTLAEFPHLAILAESFVCPLAVAELLKAILPHLPDVVGVDVALVEARADARTARNRAIDLDAHNAHARLAAKEVVPHLGLIPSEETLASVVTLDAPLLAGCFDELHQPTILLGRQLECLILGSPTYGEDCEEPPRLATVLNEELFELREVFVIVSIYTRYHIVGNAFGGGYYVKGSDGVLPTIGVATDVVVLLFEAVNRHRDGAQTRSKECAHTLLGEEHTIGDNAPGVATLVELSAHLFEVFATESLATRNYHHHLVGIDVGGNLIHRCEEIFGGHIGGGRRGATIATAVATIQIATQGTLPKDFAQFVFLGQFALDTCKEIEGQTFA